MQIQKFVRSVYDSKSTLLINFNLKLSDYLTNPKNVWLYPYNLRDGGLLLSLVEFKNELGIFENKIDNLQIIRVFDHGQYTLTLKTSYSERLK